MYTMEMLRQPPSSSCTFQYNKVKLFSGLNSNITSEI